VERAGTWFLASGIQEQSGGVARYFRADRFENARLSTEITGYAVSTLVYLHHVEATSDRGPGESAYLRAAMHAGDFLCLQAWRPELAIFPFEFPPEDGSLPPAYFFDCGIIVRGLLRLHEATGLARYLETALACGRTMARAFEACHGYHPVLALPSLAPHDYTPAWSRHPGCYQLKSALAWRELALATGEAAWDAHFLRALEFSLGTHESFLPAPDGPAKTMDRLHAYSYFLEALLGPAAAGDSRCVRALSDGLARTAALLREIAPEFERSDVSAQLLRVRLLANLNGIIPLDRPKAAEEASRAAAFQIGDGPAADLAVVSGCLPQHSGGFLFGRARGAPLPFVNPVSTAFCLQALEMWRRHNDGHFQMNLERLI
jgi:hypothetical protein